MEKSALNNRTVLITGASSGLGKSLSLKVALAGGNVFAAARNFPALNNLKDKFEQEMDARNQTNGAIIPIKTDVQDIESINNLFNIIDDRGRGIDLVINNAAVGHNGRIQDISDEELQNIVATNLLGTIYVTRESINRMIQQNEGHLVFVSSLAGKLAFPNLSIYSATKFAVEGLVESIREELSETGINITIVRPGVMDTNFFQQLEWMNSQKP